MDNFTFYSPTCFVFGKDAENETGKMVKRFGGTKVLIHYGGGSVVRSGLIDRVKASLEAENIPYLMLGGVKPNPRSGLVYEGIELCRKEGIDFILAVGGGSTIDSSKAIAAGTVYDGDFWDFYSGKPITEALPVGTILTIAAAGSEGSPDSVITLFSCQSADHRVRIPGAPGVICPATFSPMDSAGTEVHMAHAAAGSAPYLWIRLYSAWGIVSTDPARVPSSSRAEPSRT